MSGLTFESVFCGSDTPLRPSHIDKSSIPECKIAKAKADLESFMRKNPLMILEEGAKAAYQQSPSWQGVEIQNTTGTEFEMTLTLRGKTVKARASSKKLGKQRAAAEYLYQMINEGKRKDFLIPGETDEEARANIKSIAEGSTEDQKKVVAVLAKDVDKSIPTVRDFPKGIAETNYIGKLQELCQKEKVEAPSYDDIKLESTGEFMVTCTMSKQQTRGIKTKKTVAKNLAAWLMLKILQSQGNINDGFTDDIVGLLDEIEADETLASVQKSVFETKDKRSALTELLSDKSKFAGYTMEFLYPSVSSMGTHQIILNIVISRPVSPDPDDLQMGAEHTQTEEIMKASAEREREQKKKMSDTSQKTFPGHGATEEEARQSACKCALIHYHTFDFTTN